MLMDAKLIFLAILVMVMPCSMAQEKGDQAPKSDLEALKARVKEGEERINKLSQEITKLSEAIKQKRGGTVVVAEPTVSPSANSVSADTAGVDNPTPTDTKTHTVARGETLSQIAKAYDVNVKDIEQLNKIGDAKKLQAGQTIKIPVPPNASPSSSTVP